MKGQWFIVSAVIATTALAVISGMFRDYFVVDASSIARYNEDYYLDNVESVLQRTIALSPCDGLQVNIEEFLAFSESSLAELGYLLNADYTINNCGTHDVSYTLELLSDKAAFSTSGRTT